jgi:hypothetical protein
VTWRTSQAQALVGVALRNLHQRRPHLHGDAELFPQFAHQRGFARFARLALAARKLPQPGQVAAVAAPRQQDAAARIGDDRGHDVDRSGRWGTAAACDGSGRQRKRRIDNRRGGFG